jgi:hypothetical protein
LGCRVPERLPRLCRAVGLAAAAMREAIAALACSSGEGLKGNRHKLLAWGDHTRVL